MTKRGATYYYRRAVPPPLRPYFRTANGKPQTEFVFSLNTKNLADAKRLAEVKAVQVTALFDEAKSKLDRGISPQSPKAERDRFAQWEQDKADYEAEAAREMAELHAGWEIEAELEEAEDQTLAARYSRPIEQLTPEERIILRNLSPALFDPPEVIKARERQFEADWNAGFPEANEHFEILIGLRPAAPSYPRLTDIVRDHSASSHHVPKTASDWYRIIEHLVSFLGHDNAQIVTSNDLRRWRDHLKMELTPSGKPRAHKTIRDKFIAAVKGTFTHAVNEGLIESSPAAGLIFKSRQHLTSSKNRGFSTDEIQTILSAASSALTNPDYNKLTDEMRRARRWIPWILAYTGARVNEITQLRECDIKELEGHWTITITPDAGTTKTQKARIVPLHPHLVAQGVTSLAGNGTTSPIFYDPEKARGGGRNHPQYGKVAEYLATWVRKLGVTSPDVAPSHGWRHSFKSRARHYDLREEATDHILGHSPASEGRRYSSD